jgi:integrase/recombinase XerD
MTPLRQRLIRELQLRQLAPRTIEAYVAAVAGLAKFYERSPDQIQLEEVRSYLHYLIAERHLASSTSNGHASALAFFYRHVLGQSSFDLRIRQRRPSKLPEIYSQEELVRLFQAARKRMHRVLLMTTYAAGLRVSEVIYLKPIHIHSERMLIRVEQGKGRKDRYTLLSPRLLQELRDYWKEYQPGAWLFPNQERTAAMCRGTAQRIFYAAKQRAGLQRGQGIHTLRHCFATHLLEANVDLRTIQLLMGHRSLNSTAIYMHVTRKRLEQLHSPFDLLRLPQLEELDKTRR